MQSLRDYLNSTQQYESILDPNPDQVISRMTDNVIRGRIREYCTWDRQKHNRGEIWAGADRGLEITKIDKDEKGWYIETMSTTCFLLSHTNAKSFYEYCLSKGQKIDKQKGFLIEDQGIYFRWRKHKGWLDIYDAPNFESTKGLPEELDKLEMWDVCQHSNRLNVCNKIKIIALSKVNDIKISGNGCKNVLIKPGHLCDNITAHSGVKMYHPNDYGEYGYLIDKLLGH